MIEKHEFLNVLAALLPIICMGVLPLSVLADGDDTLGTPSIPIASGSGMVAAGVGLVDGQPGTISIEVPAGATVNQVLLYWEGVSFAGDPADDTAEVDDGGGAQGVVGTQIGNIPFTLSAGIQTVYYCFRADITDLNMIDSGPNSVSVGGLLDFTSRTDGAGLLVIYKEVANTASIDVRDGMDYAFRDQPAPYPPAYTETLLQTFPLTPAAYERTAKLSMFFSEVSIADDFRPTSIEIKVNGATTLLSNELKSCDGAQWDTLPRAETGPDCPAVSQDITIPAGATELTVQAFSRDDLATGRNPASLFWLVAGLSVPTEVELCADIDPATECCDPASGNVSLIDDAVACTDDVCDPNTGIVTHTPDHGRCDDGLYCNGAETCDPTLDCQPGTDPCFDGNDCTDDICDEDVDTCENSCNGTGSEDPCCRNPACSEEPICEQTPVCGDGIADPGEICGEPGLDLCPESAPICLDCVDCGIPVELLHFQTMPGSDSVTLVWETAAEIDTAGFNILRSESQGGPFEKINDVLIPGEGGPAQGASYSYVDEGLQSGATYWYQLEDIDVTGGSYIHDHVVSVTLAQGMCGAGSEAQASTLGGATRAGSVPINVIALFVAPIGAILILTRRRRR